MAINKDNMIPKLSIRQIEIRTHAHATESIEKVISIFKSLTSDENIKEQIKFGNLTGTFGQRITDLQVALKKKKQIDRFIENIRTELGDSDKFLLFNEFPRRLDNKLKFYLRIDKHMAALNKYQLSTYPNSVQIIIANFNNTPMIKADIDHLISYYNQLGIIKTEG